MNRTYVFNRMPRLRVPLPADEIKIPSPPAVSSPPRLFWYQALLPLAGILLMAGVMLAIYANPLMLLPMLVMSATTTLTSLLVRKAQQRQHKQSLQEAEQAYARVLEQKRAELERLRQEQQRLLHETDPALETLLERTRQRSPRLWERQPEDDDFLRLRLGIGTRRSNVTVVAPHPDMPDPRLETAHALEAEYAWLPQVPLAADLRGGPLGIAGPAPARFDIARALLCQLATHHAPDCVSLWAVVTPERAEEWAWIRWLPHSRDERGDMLLAADPAAADALLNDLLERLRERQNDLSSPSPLTLPSGWPWLVLLLDAPPALLAHPAVHLLLSPVGRRLNATALFVVEQPVDVPTGCRAIAALQPDGQLKHAATGEAGEARCWPDRADAPFCDALARSLAPLQIQTPQADQALPTQVRLLDLLGIEDIDHYDAAARWRERASVARLQVPIGVRRGGRPLLLDLHATAHGPHGLVAGTTGSGKSELLQTMVVGLALTHHPHDVAFVLVDFKGGGAFGGLADLPHVLGVVTDLSGRLAERALVALEAEMDRRKRCFQEAGVSDIDQYQRLYWQDALAVPLPRLVVIVDEFAELARDHPDFIDGLVGVARVGRSLGLHLILATQSPAGVVRQQIWANARFRICLRVETRQESQEMLHRPDAVSLPRIPGRGYLQVGNDDVFELFQVARVAGPYPGSRKQEVEQEERLVIRAVSPLGQRTVLFDAGRPPRAQGALCDLDVALRRMVQAAAEMGIEKLDSPWPAPLPERLVLADLLTGPSWDGQRWRECPPGLAAVLGLLDEPERQRQSVWQLPLAEQDGHALLIGAPGSGKSLWLRTLVVSLALNWPPDRLHVYLIELGGQALRVFEGLPHLGALLGPADGERVQRLLLRLLDELEERRRLCEQKGVEGVAALRARWPDAAPPAILLVIAGLAEFRTLFADEMNWLLRLLREGGACGIHVVLAGDRAGDVPATVSSLVARRVALRLAEADEYGLVLGARLRPASDQRLPPGRGWYGRPPLEFQAAAPVRAADEAAQGVELRRLVQAMDAAWQGARPAPVALLPEIVPLRPLLTAPRPPESAALAVPLGLEAQRLLPLWVDLDGDGPHWLVAATPFGGKTTLLWSWLLALAEANGPQQVQFALVSGRRDSLASLASLPHVAAFCRAADGWGPLWAFLEAEGQRRQAGTAALPRLVVAIDDYELLFDALAADRAVQEGLVSLARRGRELGLHFILAGALPDLGGAAYRDPLAKQVRVERSGFLLRVLDGSEQNPLGVRVAAAGERGALAGRGWVVRHGRSEPLQVASPGTEEAVAAWAEEIGRRWGGTNTMATAEPSPS